MAALPFLAVLLAAPIAVAAQPPPASRPLLQALDTNGDGTLSAGEIQNATASLLTLDLNHDGRLSPDEYRAAPAGAPPLTTVPKRESALRSPAQHSPESAVPPYADLLLSCLDVDGDGMLSAAELASAPGALKTLDTNADGILQPEEMMPFRASPAEEAARLFLRYDANRDGNLSRMEAPGNVRRQFSAIDTNHDGRLNLEEVTTWYATQASPRDGDVRRNDAPAANQLPAASRLAVSPAEPR